MIQLLALITFSSDNIHQRGSLALLIMLHCISMFLHQFFSLIVPSKATPWCQWHRGVWLSGVKYFCKAWLSGVRFVPLKNKKVEWNIVSYRNQQGWKLHSISFFLNLIFFTPVLMIQLSLENVFHANMSMKSAVSPWCQWFQKVWLINLSQLCKFFM